MVVLAACLLVLFCFCLSPLFVLVPCVVSLPVVFPFLDGRDRLDGRDAVSGSGDSWIEGHLFYLIVSIYILKAKLKLLPWWSLLPRLYDHKAGTSSGNRVTLSSSLFSSSFLLSFPPFFLSHAVPPSKELGWGVVPSRWNPLCIEYWSNWDNSSLFGVSRQRIAVSVCRLCINYGESKSCWRAWLRG